MKKIDYWIISTEVIDKLTNLDIILKELTNQGSCWKDVMDVLSVKELRRKTGMTQQAFADLYDIPVSTLRKWEQGEATPPAYVVRLLAKAMPQDNQMLEKLEGKNGSVFYYNAGRKSVLDQKGNEIMIQEDLEGVKRQNLILYLEDLFEDFYQIQGKFNRDCYYDKQEDIIWSRFE